MAELLDFSWAETPVFMIITDIYFLAFGFIILNYALKSRSNPEKQSHPEYFINEVIIAVMFFFIAATYPFLFGVWAPNDNAKWQFYFHAWNSLTVNLCVWPIHMHRAQYNDRRKGRHVVYEEWKAKLRETYKDNLWSDILRKAGHLIPPVLVISMYYAGHALEDAGVLASMEWDWRGFAGYGSIIFGFHYLFVMAIADIIRLTHFNKFGKFARGWFEKAIHPKELETFTSANHLMLAYVPFYFAPMNVVFTVVVISAVSDAAASIVGKAFGKKRNPNSPKTIEGYIGGVVATYLVVVAMNTLIPLGDASFWLIQGMAIAAAFAFLLVDIYAEKVSDNFLNSIVCGAAIWIVYILFG